MSKVISLFAHKEQRKFECSKEYKNKISKMGKLELLEEMVVFQDARSKSGHLTIEMMVNGQVLFKALEDAAETPELRLLTRSYRRHLAYELDSYKQKVGINE